MCGRIYSDGEAELKALENEVSMSTQINERPGFFRKISNCSSVFFIRVLVQCISLEIAFVFGMAFFRWLLIPGRINWFNSGLSGTSSFKWVLHLTQPNLPSNLNHLTSKHQAFYLSRFRYMFDNCLVRNTKFLSNNWYVSIVYQDFIESLVTSKSKCNKIITSSKARIESNVNAYWNHITVL